MGTETKIETKIKTETEIQKFFNNKKIFITGGTGFLGKVFMEKILRCTNVARIYILIRPKRGKDMKMRVKEIFKEMLFENLLSMKPNAEDLVVPVQGDCVLPCLGLSEQDQADLIENVEVIIHAAATVVFTEPLSFALNVNVRATVALINMAQKVKNLKSFVYVSSAFSNCFELYITEDNYSHKLNTTAEKALALLDVLGSEELDRLSASFIKGFPNTYTYTKALAEEAIFNQAGNLPVCIFRPGIITGSYKEPLEGWIDNMYGPIGFLFNSAVGLNHIRYLPYPEYNANIVSVDFCANLIIVSAWKTSKNFIEKSPNSPPLIYNLVPEEENMISWRTLICSVADYAALMPFSDMIWFPVVIFFNSRFFHKICYFFLNLLPAYLFDFVYRLRGKQSKKMVRKIKKIHLSEVVQDYFVENQFIFTTKNTRDLWKSLSMEDKMLFNFDLATVDWNKYVHDTIWGCRSYLAKDNPSTLPRAKKLYKRLKLYHHILRFLVYGTLLGSIVWSLHKLLM